MEPLLTALAGVVGLLLSFIGAPFRDRASAVTNLLGGGPLENLLERLGLRKAPETPRARVERLTHALTEAMDLSAEIRAEIDDRHALAEKLQKDLETYEQLVRLKQEEVEAVVQVFRGELRTESRRSFRLNFLANFLFFVAGGLVSFYLTQLAS